MKIKTKLFVFILIPSIIAFITAVSVLTYKLVSHSERTGYLQADTYAAQYANYVKAELNKEIHYSRILSQCFNGHKKFPDSVRTPFYDNMLYQVYKQNPGYFSVWTSFELWAYGNNWNYDYGRKRTEMHGETNNIKTTKDSVNLNGDVPESLYYAIKTTNQEYVTNPYYYKYEGTTDSVLETSVCVPIDINNKFGGLVGIDVPLTKFHKIVKDIKIFETGYAVLLANNSMFVGHPEDTLIGTFFNQNKSLNIDSVKFYESIQKGQPYSLKTKSKSGEEYYLSFKPITLGKSKNYWSLGIIVPTKELTKDADKGFILALIFGTSGLLIMILSTQLLAQRLNTRLSDIIATLKDLSHGKIDRKNKITKIDKDEVGEMAVSTNKAIDTLNTTAEFALEIGKGNLEMEFNPAGDEDILGKALLEMKDSLTKAKIERQKRREEDEKQAWTTRGIAKFSDILRQRSENIREFGYEIIKELVKYTDSNQGSMYLISDNEEDSLEMYLEQVAAYAWNRKKFANQKIEMGDGIIGACAFEKETVYMTDIPEDYIEIKSGLGKANPKSLILVPLKIEEDIFGVIEMASFNKYEEYQIEFLEKVAESIASTIQGVKINLRTESLLKQAQEQSEIMRQQEEEMRQNMEEMRATQEEMERKEQSLVEKDQQQQEEINKLNQENEGKIMELQFVQQEMERQKGELDAYVNAIEKGACTMEVRTDGVIVSANEKLLQYIGIESDDIITKSQTDISKDKKGYNNLYEQIESGEIAFIESTYVFNDNEYSFTETYAPIKNFMGEYDKAFVILYPKI